MTLFREFFLSCLNIINLMVSDFLQMGIGKFPKHSHYYFAIVHCDCRDQYFPKVCDLSLLKWLPLFSCLAGSVTGFMMYVLVPNTSSFGRTDWLNILKRRRNLSWLYGIGVSTCNRRLCVVEMYIFVNIYI